MPAHRYRVVVEGELGRRHASAFDGTTILTRDDTTEIRGPVIDASHLHGPVERIGGLGLTLHSVTPLETENPGVTLGRKQKLPGSTTTTRHHFRRDRER